MHKFNDWEIEKGPLAGQFIRLLKPEELKAQPEGTVLYDIFGELADSDITKLDTDTRSGYTAFGKLVTMAQHQADIEGGDAKP